MRLGTRGSVLALAQARQVAELLGGAEVVPITTSGDRATHTGDDAKPSAKRGEDTGPSHVDADGEHATRRREPADKSRWVDAIEAALLAGEIDLAVHSAKDVPGELADGLALLGAPARAAVEDVLCSVQQLPRAASEVGDRSGARDPSGRSGLDAPQARVGTHGLDALAPQARVGTSSLRRAAQLRAAREDLEIVAMRGNIDTRLGKLGTDGLDAIVLARAGLVRLGREDEIGAVLDPARFVPAPGQGVLALEGRVDDERARRAARAILDADAFACLTAERAVARALGASCNTPLGAHAAPSGRGRLNLRVWVGLPDGSEWLSDELLGGFHDPEALGLRVAERLQAAGAAELLRRAEELAVELA
jgi:hydroxymethylbilane synthase